MEMHQGRRPVYGGAPRNRPRKGYGDPPRAPARQGWAGAAPAENSKQGNLVGGPGVLRTPGRRPPHRNGGTFGSFSHERTTIIREIVKKMTSNPTQKPSNKATPAKANKEKSNVRGAAGCGVPRKVTAAGKPARPILAAFAARQGAGLPAGCETPPPPLKPIKKNQHHKRTTICRYVVTNHNSQT